MQADDDSPDEERDIKRRPEARRRTTKRNPIRTIKVRQNAAKAANLPNSRRTRRTEKKPPSAAGPPNEQTKEMVLLLSLVMAGVVF